MPVDVGAQGCMRGKPAKPESKASHRSLAMAKVKKQSLKKKAKATKAPDVPMAFRWPSEAQGGAAKARAPGAASGGLVTNKKFGRAAQAMCHRRPKG